MEEAIEGKVHLDPRDADILLIHRRHHQQGIVQGTEIVEQGVIIHAHVLGQFRDLYLLRMKGHIDQAVGRKLQRRMTVVPVARETMSQIEDHKVQGIMMKVRITRGKTVQTGGHLVRGRMIGLYLDLGLALLAPGRTVANGVLVMLRRRKSYEPWERGMR